MDIKQFVLEKAQKAKASSRKLANISTEIKNTALFKMAAGLEQDAPGLIEANKKDLAAAEQKTGAILDATNPDLKADTIHPNAKGHRVIAERVTAALRPLLQEADRRRAVSDAKRSGFFLPAFRTIG